MGGFNFPFLFIAVVIVLVTVLVSNLPIWISFLVGLIATVVVFFLIDLIIALVEKRQKRKGPSPRSIDKSLPKAPKGLTCPACGSKDKAVILYGLPPLSEELEKAIAQGQVTLGGCLIYDGAPQWVCNACDNKFGELRIPL